jgi:hypothetical protein
VIGIKGRVDIAGWVSTRSVIIVDGFGGRVDIVGRVCRSVIVVDGFRGRVVIDWVGSGITVVGRYAAAVVRVVFVMSWYSVTVVGCVFVVIRHFRRGGNG